jgi:hypothetical protein
MVLPVHNLVLEGQGWSNPRPGRLRPRKETQYLLSMRLGGSRDRSEGGTENLASTGVGNSDRPASSESLYRPSYPGRHMYKNRLRIFEIKAKNDHKFSVHDTCVG